MGVLASYQGVEFLFIRTSWFFERFPFPEGVKPNDGQGNRHSPCNKMFEYVAVIGLGTMDERTKKGGALEQKTRFPWIPEGFLWIP